MRRILELLFGKKGTASECVLWGPTPAAGSGENEGIFIVGFSDKESDLLYKNTVSAVKQMGLGETVTRLDIKDAVRYGVTLFPALIVDGKIVSEGKTHTSDELAKMLARA